MPGHRKSIIRLHRSSSIQFDSASHLRRDDGRFLSELRQHAPQPALAQTVSVVGSCIEIADALLICLGNGRLSLIVADCRVKIAYGGPTESDLTHGHTRAADASG